MICAQRAVEHLNRALMLLPRPPPLGAALKGRASSEIALSRRKQGFESPRERQSNQSLSAIYIMVDEVGGLPGGPTVTQNFVRDLWITIRRGSTRTVVRFGPWAFKFGRGKYGARCNCYEADLYRRSKSVRKSMLCPVLWCSRSGGLQIARRAGTPVTQAEVNDLKKNLTAWSEWDYAGAGDDECPFEWKPTDWGYLNGRLVAVDYAAPCQGSLTSDVCAEHFE
jgi:hypothetical protein